MRRREFRDDLHSLGVVLDKRVLVLRWRRAFESDSADDFAGECDLPGGQAACENECGNSFHSFLLPTGKKWCENLTSALFDRKTPVQVSPVLMLVLTSSYRTGGRRGHPSSSSSNLRTLIQNDLLSGVGRARQSSGRRSLATERRAED